MTHDIRQIFSKKKRKISSKNLKTLARICCPNFPPLSRSPLLFPHLPRGAISRFLSRLFAKPPATVKGSNKAAPRARHRFHHEDHPTHSSRLSLSLSLSISASVSPISQPPPTPSASTSTPATANHHHTTPQPSPFPSSTNPRRPGKTSPTLFFSASTLHCLWPRAPCATRLSSSSFAVVPPQVHPCKAHCPPQTTEVVNQPTSAARFPRCSAP